MRSTARLAAARRYAHAWAGLLSQHVIQNKKAEIKLQPHEICHADTARDDLVLFSGRFLKNIPVQEVI
ncbi:MAG: hypothetical protein ABI351_09360 [Herbaspirillum sp.]